MAAFVRRIQEHLIPASLQPAVRTLYRDALVQVSRWLGELVRLSPRLSADERIRQLESLERLRSAMTFMMMKRGSPGAVRLLPGLAVISRYLRATGTRNAEDIARYVLGLPHFVAWSSDDVFDCLELGVAWGLLNETLETGTDWDLYHVAQPALARTLERFAGEGDERFEGIPLMDQLPRPIRPFYGEIQASLAPDEFAHFSDNLQRFVLEEFRLIQQRSRAGVAPSIPRVAIEALVLLRPLHLHTEGVHSDNPKGSGVHPPITPRGRHSLH